MTRSIALYLLAALPMFGSVTRLIDLTIGPVTAENAHFMAAPLPIALHAGGLGLFLLLLPLQIGRHGHVHRLTGRVMAAASVTGALAGVWMTLSHPISPGNPAELFGLRIVIGLVLAGFILKGVCAARVGDLALHRASMIRAAAVALGAGTAGLALAPMLVLSGEISDRTNALAQAAGWLVNLAIAETLISRSRHEQKGLAA
jgi:uncharacterized membrane protein